MLIAVDLRAPSRQLQGHLLVPPKKWEVPLGDASKSRDVCAAQRLTKTEIQTIAGDRLAHPKPICEQPGGSCPSESINKQANKQTNKQNEQENKYMDPYGHCIVVLVYICYYYSFTIRCCVYLSLILLQ